eukprot:jgi/Chlat1/4129/Chrsp269S08837
MLALAGGEKFDVKARHSDDSPGVKELASNVAAILLRDEANWCTLDKTPAMSPGRAANGSKSAKLTDVHSSRACLRSSEGSAAAHNMGLHYVESAEERRHDLLGQGFSLISRSMSARHLDGVLAFWKLISGVLQLIDCKASTAITVCTREKSAQAAVSST